MDGGPLHCTAQSSVHRRSGSSLCMNAAGDSSEYLMKLSCMDRVGDPAPMEMDDLMYGVRVRP